MCSKNQRANRFLTAVKMLFWNKYGLKQNISSDGNDFKGLFPTRVELKKKILESNSAEVV